MPGSAIAINLALKTGVLFEIGPTNKGSKSSCGQLEAKELLIRKAEKKSPEDRQDVGKG